MLHVHDIVTGFPLVSGISGGARRELRYNDRPLHTVQQVTLLVIIVFPLST